MEVSYDLAVIGGGPAGCAAAIIAARAGKRVLLCEKGSYPRHRVCGEFISPESHHILEGLLGPTHPLLQTPACIKRARMFIDGHCLEFSLPKPAWSISRFDLDHALWEIAQAAGADCRTATTVHSVTADSVQVENHIVAARTVINASGRWSNLRRSSPTNNGPRWIGLKTHFFGEQALPSTDIYFFDGGYCGVQPIGPDRINASSLVRADVATSLEQVFAAHSQLWLRSRAWEQVTETVTTSPLLHAVPEPVSNGVLNAGDAAAFIDPFTGDGISLALRSGVLAAQCALTGDAQRYAREYHLRFARAFETAAFTRRLTRAPMGIRRIAAFAFRSEVVKNWTLQHTRGK